MLPVSQKTLRARPSFMSILGVSSNDLSFILQKEAVYCAIGLCSNRLQNELNFDEWMQKNLIPEAQETNPRLVFMLRIRSLD